MELNALYPRSKQIFISGPKRDFDCTSGCDVSALSEVHLLNVVSMTSGPDGRITLSFVAEKTNKTKVIQNFMESHILFDHFPEKTC